MLKSSVDMVKKIADGPAEAAVAAAGASLHGEVLSRLRDYIVEGNLAEGERVPERESGVEIVIRR